MTQPSRFHIRPIAGEDHAELSACMLTTPGFML
jgi:hypothetical protein